MKYVAYTQAYHDHGNGVLLRHVIAPVDEHAIPPEVQALFPDCLDAQIQYVGVDPEDLDQIVGVFSDYLEASTALSRAHYWRKANNGLPPAYPGVDMYEVVDHFHNIVSYPVNVVVAIRITEALNKGYRNEVYSWRKVQ